MVVAVLYFARTVFVPLALAVLLTFLLAPLVIRLRRWRLGRTPAALIVVLFSIFIVSVIGSLMGSQMTDLAHKLPEYQQNIRKKVNSIRTSGSGLITRATRTIRDLTEELIPQPPPPPNTQPAEQKPVPVEIRHAPFAPLEVVQKILGSVFSLVLVAGIVTVFVIFMLIQREDLRDRLIRLIGAGRVNVTTQALDEAADRVSRYLLALFIVNVGFGTLVGIGLYFIGVPNPLLWGIFAMLLRYVPYLGVWIAATMPALLAFAVEPGWVKVPIIFGLYAGLDFTIYNFVEPLLYGNRTGISPVAILVAAVFWTWLWGPVGLLLATPLTVCVVVLGRYVPSLEFLSVMLSDEPVLGPETRFYQRLLAKNLEEATEVAEEFLKGKSIEALYDEVIVPALTLAEEERHQGKLDDARQQFIFKKTSLLVQHLGQRADKLAAGDNSAKLQVAELENQPPKEQKEPPEPDVICIPARDQADEVAARMLEQLLSKKQVTAKALSAAALTSECLQEVGHDHAKIVCVLSVPPFGYMHARYLCRKIRAEFPDLKIVAAILTEREVEEIKQRQPSLAADELACSLKQTLDVAISLLHSGAQPATQPAALSAS